MHGENLTTVANFTVSAGEAIPFVLSWHPSNEPPPPPLDAAAAIEAAEEWWRRWAAHATYDGPWRDAVVRSLITLKALTYTPTGGIVAAATTSLPERIGGVRNWDYRYSWVRDATFTLYALLLGGFREEASAWRDWLLRAVAGAPSQLQIMYGLAGERRLPELTLGWLPGYEGSVPVRIGNAAVSQLQLDVYGEVMDSLYQARRIGIPADPLAWEVQLKLLEFLESGWHPQARGGRASPPGRLNDPDVHDDSLRRLAVDHVGLYQGHRYDLETPLEETMAALTRAVEQGKTPARASRTDGAPRHRRALWAVLLVWLPGRFQPG